MSGTTLLDILEVLGGLEDAAAVEAELRKTFTTEDPVLEITKVTPVAVVKASGKKLTADQARSLILVCKEERPAVPVEPAPAAASATPITPQPVSMDVLPPVPDDTTFLEMLRVGGVLKSPPTDVISAMRAAIASGLGMYELPDVLADRMEQFADEQGEPVAESFYRILQMVTTRAYGDLFAAIPGVTGTFISKRRKDQVLGRLNTILWPALRGFNDQLVAWSDSWTRGMANPAIGFAFLAMSQSGAAGVLPPGMLQPPDTAGLRDAAEGVIDQINKVFAGTGIPVARALAYDATRIKAILEEPGLPATVGAANREQMLRMLGVDVSADYVRLERNVTRYALAVMELKKVSAGTGEYGYLAAMLTLGLAIPWDRLGKWEVRIAKKGGQPGTGAGFRGTEREPGSRPEV